METAIGKEIIKLLKKKKMVYIPFMIIVSLMLVKKYFAPVHRIIIRTIKDTFKIFNTYYYSIFFILIVTLIIFFLLKKSNKEFIKEYEEYHPEQKKYVSKSKYPIETIIKEKKELINGKYKRVLEISIFNKLEHLIENIKGSVEFYSNRNRVFKADFKEKNIGINRGVRVYLNEINQKNRFWNEFQIKIEKIKSEVYEKESFNLEGLSFHRSYLFVLNRFNYIHIGNLILPYEISWLKEFWFREIYERIKWHFRPRHLYKKVTLKKHYKNLFKYWLRVIIYSIFTLIIIGGIIFLTSTFFIMMYKVFKIWYNALLEIFKTVIF